MDKKAVFFTMPFWRLKTRKLPLLFGLYLLCLGDKPISNFKLDVFEKKRMSPPCAFLRERCWRKAKNEVWPFWNGSVYYGKKNMHIYIYENQ